jgi:hypothetical protein
MCIISIPIIKIMRNGITYNQNKKNMLKIHETNGWENIILNGIIIELAIHTKNFISYKC